MKRSSLSYLISAGALLALAPAASHAQAAWDGQIRFTGSVSDTTCSVNGGQVLRATSLMCGSATWIPMRRKALAVGQHWLQADVQDQPVQLQLAHASAYNPASGRTNRNARRRH